VQDEGEFPEFLSGPIPGVRFWKTFHSDTLGQWGARIKAAVEETLNAKAGFSAMPMGRICVVVVSEAFEGLDNAAREAAVRKVVRTLGPDAASRISSVLALTPNEHLDLMEWHPAVERIAELLQSRLGGDIGYAALPGAESRTVTVALPNEEGLVTLEFTPEYLRRVPIDVNAVGGRLYEDGVVTTLSQAPRGNHKIFVDIGGITRIDRLGV
jgi:hypothetical protein